MQCNGRRSSDVFTGNLLEASSVEQMACLVETYACRDARYADGWPSGSVAFIRHVKKLLLSTSLEFIL